MNSHRPIVPTVKRYVASLAGGTALLLVAGLASGCGGVNGSHSVSPASFFLPGLIHHEAPPAKAPERATELPGDQELPLSGEPGKILAG